MNPSGKRLITRCSKQWVQPDQCVAATAQTVHFGSQPVCIPAVPTIADDEDDGTSPEYPAGPTIVEVLESFSNPSSPAPVRSDRHSPGQRQVDIPVSKLASNATQPGTEEKHFNMLPAPAQHITELEQNSRI